MLKKDLYLNCMFSKLIKEKAFFFSTAAFSKKKFIKIQEFNTKKGSIYIKSTKRNIFCTLLGAEDKKVKTSCSLRIPEYINEFNERESLFKRGILLGKLLGERINSLGYREVSIYLDFSINKRRRGIVIGLKKRGIKILLIQLSKGYSHNGCRPKKIRRKKFRTKFKN